MSAALIAVGVDSATPARLARWWAETLGWRVRPYSDSDVARLAEQGRTPDTDPAVAVEPPTAGPPTLWFNEVPEPKVGKVRIHVDIRLDADDPADLVSRGAMVLREPDSEIHWWVLSDPEGNEFCAFPETA